MYVRIVDKGPDMLWGFCRVCAWDVILPFVTQEGYTLIAGEGQTVLDCFMKIEEKTEGLALERKKQGPAVMPFV